MAGIVAVSAVLCPLLWLHAFPALGQTTAYRAPRTADGKPDLSGIWQAINTAHWDIQDHSSRQGPVLALGAAFSVVGGMGVVEGNELPYQPWALKKKQENQASAVKLDPEVKCYMPGIPRATYMPYPFQIVQTPTHVLMAYQFAAASRVVYMDPKTEEAPAPFWMGWSRGRWEGDSLVIDVISQSDQTWFDRAGNFHSEDLHVVERYTATGPDHLRYEATITDPKVFTRPWKMSMPLYRLKEPHAHLVEYECVEFVEELMYGDFYKR